MRRTSLALILAAVLVTGCTSSGSSSSSQDFDGEQEAVANVIDDLADAARDDDGEKACKELLAKALRDQLGTRCAATLEQAFDDADTTDMSVESVRVSGNGARAQVEPGRDGEDAERRTFDLVLEGRDWRISSFG